MPATPLRAAHEALGARFTDFGGWEMPLQYEGVIAEHMAVRRNVGVFDVTHLGRFHLTGPRATKTIRHELCNDIDDIEPGQAQYTMALNASGGVVDDIIVWRFGEEDYWVMPNGVNYDELLARFTSAKNTSAVPIRSETALLAVQGPDSRSACSATSSASSPAGSGCTKASSMVRRCGWRVPGTPARKGPR